MKISMTDYLNWNPDLSNVSLEFGYSSLNGIIFRWIGNDGKEHQKAVNTIEKADGFVIGFQCGQGSDR